MSDNKRAPCWNCGSYTPQQIGSIAHFCRWDCAVMWDEGQSIQPDTDRSEKKR